MPEMPEVEGLVEYLRGRVTGLRVDKATVSAINALKTYDPPLTALVGARITGVDRHGKFVDVSSDAGIHLVFHLAKAGWLRWYDALPTTIIKPARRRSRCAWASTMARVSTSPRPARRSRSPCTPCAPPPRCRASHGWVPIR